MKELRHLEGGPKVMSLKTLGAPAEDLRRSGGAPMVQISRILDSEIMNEDL